ncbi:MAG: AraC family transcriptional regulator [Ferrovibrio sp.]
MIESPGIASPARPDRLSAFFTAFALSARLLPAESEANANLLVTAGADGAPTAVIFHARGAAPATEPGLLVAAAVEFGGGANPLITALPDRLAVQIAELPVLHAVATAFVAEAQARRCGRDTALNRLCEVMLLLVLRQAIDAGASRTGLLAGLSHPALHRAIVAMHDAPARLWRVEDLAALSGMSRSRFIATFRHVVGVTPGAYLTGWRLTLGHGDLVRGEPVKTVARRVGFGSAAAFSRAYARRFGKPPLQTRREAA